MDVRFTYLVDTWVIPVSGRSVAPTRQSPCKRDTSNPTNNQPTNTILNTVVPTRISFEFSESPAVLRCVGRIQGRDLNQPLHALTQF